MCSCAMLWCEQPPVSDAGSSPSGTPRDDAKASKNDDGDRDREKERVKAQQAKAQADIKVDSGRPLP